MSASADPLESTWRDTMKDLRKKVADSVGVELGSPANVQKAVLEAVLEEFGLDAPVRKREQVEKIRDRHPKLGERSPMKLSVQELRDVFASLERGETFDE